MVHRLRRVAAKRLSIWAEAKRDELFEYYQSRMQLFNTFPMSIHGTGCVHGPVSFILKQVSAFLTITGTSSRQEPTSPNFLITTASSGLEKQVLSKLSRLRGYH